MTTKTFALSGPINLAARVGHGSLTVHCVDDLTEARVEMASRKGSGEFLERITVQMDGPTLTISAPRQGGVFDLFGDRWRTGASVDIDVTVPSGTALKISSFTADITVTGRCAGADVATGTGRIQLDHVDGDLRLRYGASHSVIGRVSGSAIVKSGSGDTRLGEIGGDLQCACGSGRLEAAAVRGSVKSRCGAGEARLGAVYGDVDLASGSGAISVGLPKGVTARVDVHTGSGDLRSELPIEDEPVDRSGAITLRARTGSGDVHVFRAA
ncbi:MAG TPA: DUF4097 family beta strand repeat-containing protein [Jatrophihabitans sp.]|nr:DUF4097 family beta strand repeat-containing protein [Jatrophihabitans sp.]